MEIQKKNKHFYKPVVIKNEWYTTPPLEPVSRQKFGFVLTRTEKSKEVLASEMPVLNKIQNSWQTLPKANLNNQLCFSSSVKGL